MITRHHNLDLNQQKYLEWLLADYMPSAKINDIIPFHKKMQDGDVLDQNGIMYYGTLNVGNSVNGYVDIINPDSFSVVFKQGCYQHILAEGIEAHEFCIFTGWKIQYDGAVQTPGGDTPPIVLPITDLLMIADTHVNDGLQPLRAIMSADATLNYQALTLLDKDNVEIMTHLKRVLYDDSIQAPLVVKYADGSKSVTGINFNPSKIVLPFEVYPLDNNTIRIKNNTGYDFTVAFLDSSYLNTSNLDIPNGADLLLENAKDNVNKVFATISIFTLGGGSNVYTYISDFNDCMIDLNWPPAPLPPATFDFVTFKKGDHYVRLTNVGNERYYVEWVDSTNSVIDSTTIEVGGDTLYATYADRLLTEPGITCNIYSDITLLLKQTFDWSAYVPSIPLDV